MRITHRPDWGHDGLGGVQNKGRGVKRWEGEKVEQEEGVRALRAEWAATGEDTKKVPRNLLQSTLGGAKRNRTAVAGFADLCLAPRPSHHLFIRRPLKTPFKSFMVRFGEQN